MEGVTEKSIYLADNKEPVLSFPGMIIKVDAGVVLRDDRPVKLTYGEFSMLCHMAKHPNHIFTKEQLYTVSHGREHCGSNTVQDTICRLRRKIEPVPHSPTYIKTVIGIGYKFEIPEQ